MLRDTLFTLLSQRLGNRPDLVSRMATEFTLLQTTKLEKNAWVPWFLESSLNDLSTVAGVEYVALPANFLSEVEEQALWYYAAAEKPAYIPLKKMDFDDMMLSSPGIGLPTSYSLFASRIYFGPVPDAVYPLKFTYNAKDTVLSADGENLWLTHASDLVIAELGAVMAGQHMQHQALANTFTVEIQKAWERLYRETIARQEVNRERVMEN
jgi:hypothetical protein